MTCSKDFKTKYFSFIKCVVLCDVDCGSLAPWPCYGHAQLNIHKWAPHTSTEHGWVFISGVRAHRALTTEPPALVCPPDPDTSWVVSRQLLTLSGDGGCLILQKLLGSVLGFEPLWAGYPNGFLQCVLPDKGREWVIVQMWTWALHCGHW